MQEIARMQAVRLIELFDTHEKAFNGLYNDLQTAVEEVE